MFGKFEPLDAMVLQSNFYKKGEHSKRLVRPVGALRSFKLSVRML